MNTNTPHTVKSYEEELKNLNNNIVKMGTLCEEALRRSINALVTNNADEADKTIKNDEEIDKFENLIEQQVVNLINIINWL